ncbi:MAG: FAD-dependent oxidoreductase [Bacillota bacterium]
MQVFKKEVVVVGGGPAGLAAAIESAKAGAEVLLVDENKKPGGQLFKQIHKFFGSREHNAGIRGFKIGEALLDENEKAGVEVWLNSAAIGLFKDKKVAIVRENGGVRKTEVVHAQKILLACGASENAINFPGWTLPGVMSAGAAQTFINVHRVLPGKRVLMVGSGNVGLIVSYQLMQAGADVVGIVEGMNKIGGYGVHAAKVKRAGVPFYLAHTIVKAEGDEQVTRAVIAKVDENWQPIPGSEKALDVDTICLAVGLRPLAELAWMHDLEFDFIPELGGWMPRHDDNMESSVPGIYVAGDIAGVEEANTAMDEGRLAGTAMAEALGYITPGEAFLRKEEIRKRLAALRQGPFGAKRQAAKERALGRGI